MLSQPTEEAEKGRIIVKDVDPEVLKQMLEFMYTDEVGPKILGEIAEELYRAADKYGMEKLLRFCEDYLLDNITASNALVMYDLAVGSRPDSLLANKSRRIISE